MKNSLLPILILTCTSLLVLVSCKSKNIHLANDWVIHDNVECDWVLEHSSAYGEYKCVPMQEYCTLNDSIVVTSYNQPIGAYKEYTVVNLNSLEILIYRENIDFNVAGGKINVQSIDFTKP